MNPRRFLPALPFLTCASLAIATSCAKETAFESAPPPAPSTGGAASASSSSITQANQCPTICQAAVACGESGPIGCDQTCETMLQTQCATALKALEACFEANADTFLACGKTAACDDAAAAYISCASQIDMSSGAEAVAVSSGSDGAGGGCGEANCSIFFGQGCNCMRTCKPTDVAFDCSNIPGAMYCLCEPQGGSPPFTACLNKEDNCVSFEDNCCEK